MEVENPPWKKEVLLRPCQRSPGQGRRGSAVAVLITGCTHDANQFQFQFLDDKLQRVLLLSHFYNSEKQANGKQKHRIIRCGGWMWIWGISTQTRSSVVAAKPVFHTQAGLIAETCLSLSQTAHWPSLSTKTTAVAAHSWEAEAEEDATHVEARRDTSGRMFSLFCTSTQACADNQRE